jgi:predicted transcriptional regulator
MVPNESTVGVLGPLEEEVMRMCWAAAAPLTVRDVLDGTAREDICAGYSHCH